MGATVANVYKSNSVVKLSSLHLIYFCGGRQIIASKSATALILGRYAA